MPGQKISELTSLADTAIAGGDLLPIVDVSAGVTKKITFADTISAQRFPSRTAMVAQLAVLQTMCPEGAVISDGKLDYVKTTGATAISDFEDFLPYGPLSPSHFGENAIPGTTDMSAAVDACFAYANTLGATIFDQTYGAVIDGRGEAFALQSRVTLTDEVGIYVKECFFGAIGTWGSNLSMFRVPVLSGESRRDIIFQNCTFDGNHKTNGVLIENSSGMAFKACAFHGTPDYAVKTLVRAGELRVESCAFNQFYWGETGYNIEASRTAVLLDIDTADYFIHGSVFAYAYEGLNIKTRGPGQVIGNHFYNGTLIDATENTRNATITGPNCQVVGNYFDNGLLRVSAAQIDSTSFALVGNLFHKTGNATNTNELEFFDGNNSDLDGLVIVGNTFNNGSTAILYTGTYVSSELRRWSVSGNVAKDGSNITGLPEFASRDTFYADTTDGFFYKGASHTYNNSTADSTDFKFVRSVSFDVDYDNNSGAAQSIGTLKVHGVEKFRWGENLLTASSYMQFADQNRLGLGIFPAERLHIAGEDTDEDSRIRLERAYDGSLGPRILFRKARGDLDTLTATLTNDRIGVISFSGNSGSGYISVAEIRADATEDTTTGSSAGAVVISATATGSTSAAERLRVDGGGIEVVGAVEINGSAIWCQNITIADDAVATITLPSNLRGGILSLKVGGGSNRVLDNWTCDIAYNTVTSATAEKSTGFASRGADVNVQNGGTLTGTTGTDGKITVSPQLDGTIQIENRSGASRSINLFAR